MKPSSVRKKFFGVLSALEKNIHLFVRRPGSDMTRHRCCDLKSTVLAMLNLSMCRNNTELTSFFGVKNKHIPSKSAFIQQRQKLKADFFPQLLNDFNTAVPFKKTYKGFHLVAVDGSDINLPTCRTDNIYRIKQARSDGCYYQLHLNALYDICENRYIAALTQPRPQMNEREALCRLVDECSMPDNTIYIADRGYINSNLLAHLIENRKYFLIRAKSPVSPGSYTRELMAVDAESDRVVTLGLTRSRKKLYARQPGRYKLLRGDRRFDYIKDDDLKTVYNMSLRCTCVSLGNGSYEYLLSNLPQDKFTAAELKELYWKRWSIETSFRSLKYALSLVYLHSVNRELIIQEIYAKMLLYNITSLIHDYAQQSSELLKHNESRKHAYKVSFDDAVPLAKAMLIRFISNSHIKVMLLKHLTAIKAFTAGARRTRSQRVFPLNTRA